MIEFLKFYFVVEILGIIIFPLSFYVFKPLSDKGLTFSKPVALLVVSYFLWIFSVFKIVPNSYLGIISILFLVSIASFLMFIKAKKEITDFVVNKFKKIIFIEIFFLIAFAGATFLRSFVPDISGTEKPFEFMLFNSIIRSEFFPPYDAWYGGLAMSYYYFGYVILSTVTILAKVSSSIAFNLGVSLTFALTATGVFGLSYNLIKLRPVIPAKAGIHRTWIIPLFCLFIVFLFLIFSNFEGALELLAINGIGDKNFYSFFNVEGLEPHKISSSWYPTEHWFWWRATRLASNWNVMEFPFFSFLLGDLHPHMLVLPYATITLGIFIVLLTQKKVLNFNWIIKNPVLFFITVLIMGGVAGINTWFYPSFLAFLIILTIAKNYLLSLPSVIPARRSPRRASPLGGKTGIQKEYGSPIRLASLKLRRSGSGMTRIKDTLSFILPVGVLSILSFLPLFLTTNTSMNKILPNELLNKAGFIPKEAIASSLVQLFLFWGPLFLLILIVTFWRMFNYPIKKIWKQAIILSFLPFFMWCINIVYSRGLSGFINELKAREFTLLSVIILTIILALSIQSLLQIVFSRKKNLWEGTLLSAVSILLGLLLILGAELFYINDAMQGRYNTVFKFYFISWMFLSIGAGIGIYEMLSDWFKDKFQLTKTKLIVLIIFFLTIISTSLYPISATFNRTNSFRSKISIDGLEYLKNSSSDEYTAILWLKQNVKGKQIIIEASGGDYSSDNLVSAMTGLPTIIGMSNHEFVIHNDYEELQKRLSAVETIYKTSDLAKAKRLLNQYKVIYVYVGPREIAKYENADFEKFSNLGKSVYKNDNVNIYSIGN